MRSLQTLLAARLLNNVEWRVSDSLTRWSLIQRQQTDTKAKYGCHCTQMQLFALRGRH
jgi:hypothetical protein